MNRRRNIVLICIILSSLMIASPLWAQEHAAKPHVSKQMHPRKASGHKAASHAPKKGHGKHQGGMHLFSEDWHDTLDDHQRIKVDAMHLQLMKDTQAIKAMITVKKTELAVLATQDHPDTDAMNKKIDEILDLKRMKIRARFAHIVEMREILSPEQRISYDMRIISRAAKRKK